MTKMMRSVKKSFKFAVYTEAAHEIPKADVVIWDEFLESLRNLDLHIGVGKTLPAILQVANNQKPRMVFVQAHYSQGFLELLKEYVGKFDSVAEKEMMLKGAFMKANLNLKCTLHEDVAELERLALLTVEQYRTKSPVVVFGFTEARVKALNVKDCRYLNDRVSVGNACDSALTQDRGVVFVSDKYKVGLNLKFLVDAYVVVLHAHTTLATEDLLQMLGRGARANTNHYHGAVFMKDNPLD